MSKIQHNKPAITCIGLWIDFNVKLPAIAIFILDAATKPRMYAGGCYPELVCHSCSVMGSAANDGLPLVGWGWWAALFDFCR